MIILGAGLAGLSAAYHLPDSVVFEQSGRVGGHAKSAIRDGFIFDEGIHVLHTKNDYVLQLLGGPANAVLQEREREAWIYHYDVLTRYPFQANTFGLPVDVVKDCLLGFIQNDFPEDRVKTYEDWLQYQFGLGICERFMIPYSTKFWGVHPRELTTEWVAVRHPRPSLDEVLTGALGDQTKGFGVNARFRYPEKGGFSAIGEALADAVGRHRIQAGHCVTRVDVDRREIEFNDGAVKRSYKALISTLPLPDLVRLIPMAPAEIRDAAGRLRTNSIFVVNLGINRPDLTTHHWVYYPEPDYSFFRISFPMNFAAGLVPPGTSSVSCEIAYGNARDIDRQGIVERVVDDLRRSKVLTRHDRIIFEDTVDIRYAYVLYDEHRRPAAKAIQAYLELHGIHSCGRYGEWAYLWSDEAILSGRRAARRLLQGAAVQETS